MITPLKRFILILFLLLPLNASGMPGAEIGNMVIRQDTTWSGRIIIKGVVVVGRGVTLSISPGTIIAFRRLDQNDDGVGDGEIRVLGRLLAKGSAVRPITFRSAEPDPRPRDWSYVLLFTSGRKSVIDYCRFQYAFSGLQVQFSTATVTNCLFANNNEGLRFGRAKLNIDHNEFRDNNIAIRFTRMEGPVEIKFNDISHNHVGIFLVPSGQNIVDFFDPGHSGRPWNEGHLEIVNNNIYANDDYNLKLGAKQKWNLKISGNWWGGADPRIIRAGIFDHQRDPDLGRALITPLSATRISEAGIKNCVPLRRP
ncbi:MAG: right-handed parallel beta-helix repeat-containing protein [Deltaproteobacteria bacterium]|nr:right-handed parallel beta-helix repeat-containing protein [Deltaproteobacteria bacterium]